MTSIVLIEHNGNIKSVKPKELTRETLYKKCGFRSNENFEKTATWEVEHNKEMFIIELWAKNEGKANNENKYDFPPPVDNSLYYGTCALIRVDDKDRIIHLTSEVWLKLYEKLFGGFEDLDEDGGEEDDEDIGDDEEEEEEEVLNKTPKKVKKVKKDEEDEDDEDDEDECGEDEEQEEEEEEVRKKPSKKTTVVNESEEEEIEDYYGSELEEEAYSYSDDD